MAQPSGLRIRGARQNNLKNISLEIPHDRLTVMTGVSGSGKSSLAFDTLFAEGQWRYIESLSTYARMFLDRVDRPDVDRIEQIRPAVALEQKNPVRTARSTVGTATEIYDYLRLLYAKIGRVFCPQCGAAAASQSPESMADTLLGEHAGARALVTFPLPVPAGQPAADLWAGLTRRGFARVLVDGAVCDLAAPPPGTLDGTLAVVLDRVVLDPAHRHRLVESLESALREGGGRVAVELVAGGRGVFAEAFRCGGCGMVLERPQPLLFSFNHPLGACPECKGFANVLKYDEALLVPDRTRTLADGAVEPWTHPSGKWYQRELLKAAKRSGVDVTRPWDTLEETHRAFVYEGDGKFPGINGFFEEIESYRYKLHVRVFLSRYRSQSPCPVCRGARLKAPALAVRVAGMTIAEFTGLTIEAAAGVLRELKLTAWEAAVGREILRQLGAKLTFLLRVGLGYLTLCRQPRPLARRPGRRALVLTGAREHNLKDVTLRLPLATLTVVTGVSGSGKSTLVHDTLYRAVARAFKTEFASPGAYDTLTGVEYLKGVRLIDQEPIGRTPRSNPVTYVKAFDEIRKLYAALPRAKALSLGAGAFSFNVPGGRCESCQGDGVKKLLGVLNRLVDAGNTVLIVEHHLDVIKCADHLIDLGTEGGEEGGEIVAEGTPEIVAQIPGSYTGKFLAEVLPKTNGKR